MMPSLRLIATASALCLLAGVALGADVPAAGQAFDGPLGSYLTPSYGAPAGGVSAPGLSPLGGWGDATGAGAAAGYQGLSPAAAGFVTGQWGGAPATTAPAPTPWAAPAAGWWGEGGATQLPQAPLMWNQSVPGAAQAPAEGTFAPLPAWQGVDGQDATFGATGAWQPFGAPAAPAAPQATPGGMWLTPPAAAAPSLPDMTWSAPGGWGQGMWFETAPAGTPAPNPWQPTQMFPAQAPGAAQGSATTPQQPAGLPFGATGGLAPTPWAPAAPQQQGFPGTIAPQPDMAAPAQGGQLAPNPWVTTEPLGSRPQPTQSAASTAPMSPLWVQPDMFQPGVFTPAQPGAQGAAPTPMPGQSPAGGVPGVIQAPAPGGATDWWQRMTVPNPSAPASGAAQPQDARGASPGAPIRLEPPAPPTAGQWTIPTAP